MPSRRMIDPAFWESLTVASWPFFQRLLFAGLFSQADDQGRLKGHPVLVRSKVFPYDDIPMDEIDAALEVYGASESIMRYNVDGIDYIQLVNWWKWQRALWAWPSKMPPPPNWEDRHCYRKGNTVVRQNWGDSDDTNGPDESTSGATMAPLSAHSEAPAPNNNNSNSNSGNIALEIATTTDPVVAAVQAMRAHGMTNAEDVLDETDLTPAQLIDNVRYAKAHDLGAGWVREQARQNQAHAPPLNEDDWRRFLCKDCDAYPCTCGKLEEVKA